MKSRLHILLVEDTLSDVRLTEEALKDSALNYELTVLTDGEQAIDFFKEAAGTDKQPDLVLLDLNMPKKTGHEVLEEIKDIEALKKMPVILLTVSRDQEDIAKALDMKMNYYLGKPVTTEKLTTLLKAIQDLASDERTTSQLQGEDAHVRYVMAGNPHTSPEVLAKLATERNPRIRTRVAENPKTKRELLDALSNDPNPEVRMGIIDNPSAPMDILERLARDPSEDVRLALASNPRVPKNILMRLASDAQPHIVAMAQKSMGGAQPGASV